MKVNWTVYLILNIVAAGLVKVNRFVGNLYTKMWGLFGVTWYDHRLDYLRGPDNWYWCQRGVFGNRAIKPGDIVLDLCCGDGIYSGLFYSTSAEYVDAIDRDERAIAVAKRRYSRPNVRFLVADAINEPFPRTDYNVVFLFEAIEHFSAEAGTHLLQKIALALSHKDGTLIGSTPILPHRGGHNPEHDNEFLSVEQLRLFLQPHFSEVDLWCSKWPTRIACYFCCKHPIILSEAEIEAAVEHYNEFLQGS